MATSTIHPGNEYKLETTGGSTVRVEAQSEIWENSKGIEGFDARLLEDFGNKNAGDFYIIQTHIFDVVDTEPRGQCEVCDTVIPESELRFENVPGATLAFCKGCSR